MNNLGPKKTKWLEDQGCYFEKDDADLICNSTQIYINTDSGKVYVGLADLGEKEDTVEEEKNPVTKENEEQAEVVNEEKEVEFLSRILWLCIK